MPFPTKQLAFEAAGVDAQLISQIADLKSLIRGTVDTSPTWLRTSGAANVAFLPKFSDCFKTTEDGVKVFTTDKNHAASYANKGSHTEICEKFSDLTYPTIFKVNTAGFFYRQRYVGSYNQAPEVAIWVVNTNKAITSSTDKAKVAALNWTLLYRSRGSGDYAADGENRPNGANAMFPIMPGAFTYVMIKTSVATFSAGAAGHVGLQFIPAAGTPVTVAPLTKIASAAAYMPNKLMTSEFKNLYTTFAI